MTITADRNMPLAPEAFATLGKVAIVDGRALQATDLADTTILAIRSTTKVNAALLDGTPVRFVGTATIGTDHLDIPYLEKRGIDWVYAPGCNARSVAEYITAALLLLAVRHGVALAGQTIGIIGVGNVGRRVAEQAKALGLRVLLNDPPRSRTEGPDAFCDLETLLGESDFVTLHVPLERTGSDPTYHMAGNAFFARMKRGAFFLNAARGAIVDTDALIAALDAGQVRGAIIDTWEGEPQISRALLDRVEIGTPHIAGHSYEGKANGTIMVYEAACRFLARPAVFDPAPQMPPALLPETAFPAGRPALEALQALVAQVYDITADHARFIEQGTNPTGFDHLRKNYPIRREFACTTVTGIKDPALMAQIHALGFS